MNYGETESWERDINSKTPFGRYWVQKYKHIPEGEPVFLKRIFDSDPEWSKGAGCKSCKHRDAYFYPGKHCAHPESVYCRKNDFDLMKVCHRCVGYGEWENYSCKHWEQRNDTDDFYKNIGDPLNYHIAIM
jgi:hypothetical protein